MARIMLIFNNEVASYYAEKHCTDNNIHFSKMEIEEDGGAIITDEQGLDTLISIANDYEIEHKVV